MFLAYGILREDFKRILSNVPYIKQAVPIREMRKEIRNGGRSMEGRVVGCTAAYKDLNRLQIMRGRFIEDKDENPPENVCVLAAESVQRLFAYEDPIGRTIRIDANFYVVIGQTESRDPTAAIGGSLDSQDFNLDVYIPLQTQRVRIGDTVFTSRSGSNEGEIVELSQITLGVDSLENVDETADIVRILMEKYHPLSDVGIVVPKELLRQAEVLRMMFNMLLVLIAGISLVVGGIGIMNIMLVSVTERTREIGLRQAVGATTGDILLQFLVEAVAISLIGGLAGIGVGVVASLIISHVAHWSTVLNASSITLAFAFSVLVGVFFGYYPARKAAFLDPIQALRYE
jgi:putative ABC transport system permease protein